MLLHPLCFLLFVNIFVKNAKPSVWVSSKMKPSTLWVSRSGQASWNQPLGLTCSPGITSSSTKNNEPPTHTHVCAHKEVNNPERLFTASTSLHSLEHWDTFYEGWRGNLNVSGDTVKRNRTFPSSSKSCNISYFSQQIPLKRPKPTMSIQRQIYCAVPWSSIVVHILLKNTVWHLHLLVWTHTL